MMAIKVRAEVSHPKDSTISITDGDYSMWFGLKDAKKVAQDMLSLVKAIEIQVAALDKAVSK
jgi:hypothetical protein